MFKTAVRKAVARGQAYSKCNRADMSVQLIRVCIVRVHCDISRAKIAACLTTIIKDMQKSPSAEHRFVGDFFVRYSKKSYRVKRLFKAQRLPFDCHLVAFVVYFKKNKGSRR